MPAKYEVTDLGDPPTSEHGAQKRSGGCYVKTATGKALDTYRVHTL